MPRRGRGEPTATPRVWEENQLKEDVGGQRETRILGAELSLKESEDVNKRDQ